MVTRTKVATGVEANGAKRQGPPPEVKTLTIPPPRLEVHEFVVRGTAPYVQNKFSNKARQQIKETQEAGQQAKSRKKRDAKNFTENFENAKHVSDEGWLGIPATSFRSAMISACRLIGFKMTIAKMALFVLADGYEGDGTALVRIEGEPEYHEGYVRNSSGVVDLRARPMWKEWSAVVRVRFDAEQFSGADVANLLMRAGMQVGIGEGRPDSKESHGMGWGTFEIVQDEA